MHLIVVVEELMDSSGRVGATTVAVIAIQRKSAIVTGHTDIAAIRRPVQVIKVVHGVLINGVNTVLDYFLHHLHTSYIV